MWKGGNLEDCCQVEPLQESTSTVCPHLLEFCVIGLLSVFRDIPSVQCRQPAKMYSWVATNFNPTVTKVKKCCDHATVQQSM